jgi:hypothetical protein
LVPIFVKPDPCRVSDLGRLTTWGTHARLQRAFRHIHGNYKMDILCDHLAEPYPDDVDRLDIDEGIYDPPEFEWHDSMDIELDEKQQRALDIALAVAKAQDEIKAQATSAPATADAGNTQEVKTDDEMQVWVGKTATTSATKPPAKTRADKTAAKAKRHQTLSPGDAAKSPPASTPTHTGGGAGRTYNRSHTVSDYQEEAQDEGSTNTRAGPSPGIYDASYSAPCSTRGGHRGYGHARR